MRKVLKPEEAYHLINHGPCNLITTGDGTRQNVAPINWTLPLNNDPALMLTVVEGRIFTAELLRASRQFVINVVGESLAEITLACGRCHGSQIDKFRKFGLTALPSQRVKPPFLKESIAHIECELVGEHPYDSVSIFTGKVLHAEVEESCWDGKALIVEQAKTIHHLTGGAFVVAERVIRVRKDRLA